MDLFENMIKKSLNQHFTDSSTVGKDATFINAKFEAIHRWFPYLEGFSEGFVEDIIEHLQINVSSIYEPFAGSGTLPVHSIANGYDIFYSEVNPFLQKLIDMKIRIMSLKASKRQKFIQEVQSIVNDISASIKKSTPSEDLKKTLSDTFPGLTYFPEHNLNQILKARSFIDTIKDELIASTIEMACCEALLHSSFLKRAGDIRYRKGKELDQIVEFESRIVANLQNIIDDLSELPILATTPSHCFTPNAKHFDKKIDNKIDLIITSPPYLNGTNYIRNTKLELWFLRFLRTKSDLGHYRKLVVTAGINDVSREKKPIELPRLKNLLSDGSLWYDKRIPKMINDYFYDMRRVLENSHRYLRKGGLIFIDIGDSIYGGIHIPTDELLIDLILNTGFKFNENIKLRERRSKSGEIVKQTLLVAEKI